MSALGAGLSMALKFKEANRHSSLPWLKEISDAGRVLAGLHNDFSKTRQKIVMPLITNPNLKKLAENCVVDKLLFGGDLPDKIKAAKDVEKISSDLKSTPKQRSTPRPKNGQDKRKDKLPLNWNRPPRQTDPKVKSGGQYQARRRNYPSRGAHRN